MSLAETNAPIVDVVVKIGGGLLAHDQHFNAVLTTLAEASASRRLLIVPGGGPFADAVRQVDRQMKLSDTAAHWMAVLATDQYAHLLVSRLRNAELVMGPDEIVAALDAARLPVLAPSRWLLDVDPLPHSWDVTSDSIAGWVAGIVGARRLVLVKPPGAPDQAVDPYFYRSLPATIIAADILPADQISALRRALTV